MSDNEEKGTALVAFEPTRLTSTELTTLKTTFAKDSTDEEFGMFLEVCKFAGLNPFLRQAHFVKRAGVGTVQVGIDGYRSMAEDTGEYVGQDEPTFEYNEDKSLRSATVRVYRRGWEHPIGATALWDEYAQVFNGKLGAMWEKMPHVMLSKCAEALALRKAFPRRLSGIYTDEEMMQVDAEVRVLPAPKAPRPIPGGTKRATPAAPPGDGPLSLCPIHGETWVAGKFGFYHWTQEPDPKDAKKHLPCSRSKVLHEMLLNKFGGKELADAYLRNAGLGAWSTLTDEQRWAAVVGATETAPSVAEEAEYVPLEEELVP
jgi:phage recombination protein Bet